MLQMYVKQLIEMCHPLFYPLIMHVKQVTQCNIHFVLAKQSKTHIANVSSIFLCVQMHVKQVTQCNTHDMFTNAS